VTQTRKNANVFKGYVQFVCAGEHLKKEITSFDIAAVVRELKQLMIGAWIANIYQPNFKTIILKLHKPDEPASFFLIEAGKRLHLTRFIQEKPTKPHQFCMALRRFLRNGRIETIEQLEFERIVTIAIRAKREKFQLVTELFGDGNIILVNPENRIQQALTYRRMRDRNILRNEAFQYPPSSGKNPFRMQRNDLDEIRNFGQLQIVKALARFLGVGGFYAEEILLRAQVGKNAACDALNGKDLDAVFNALKELLSAIETRQLKPLIMIDEEGKAVDATPFPLKKYADFQGKLYSSFNEALDEYYAEIGMKEEHAKVAEDTGQLLAEQQRILAKQQKTLEEIKQENEKNKKIGDVIYAHFGELQLLLQKIAEAKNNGKPWSDVVAAIEKEKNQGAIPAVYCSSFDFKNAVLHLSVDGLTFPVNLRKSIQENAAEYYEKAKKAQQKSRGAEKAILQTGQKLEGLERKRTEKMAAISKPVPREVKKKAWYEKFRWFHSSEGFLVLGGKDATTNEILIKKHTNPTDLVFHADIAGAPFVVVKTDGHTVSEQTIKETAEFAAAFSRAWKEMYAAVDVYWVRPEQVSKTPPSGEFLQKGSFMIYGKKNYLRKVQLKTSMGIAMKEDEIRIIGGPKNAISSQTNYYIEIAPGEQPSGTLAKQIQQLLSQKVPKELREKVLSITLDEFQKFIPSGKGTILC
jgi:predicted ribosome quality control (RQC) complex YloA/Tae2 family protein